MHFNFITYMHGYVIMKRYWSLKTKHVKLKQHINKHLALYSRNTRFIINIKLPEIKYGVTNQSSDRLADRNTDQSTQQSKNK